MKPIIIYSDKFLNLFSWFGYVTGLSLFPFVLIRKKHKNTTRGLFIRNHETIHFRQQLELFIVFFYLFYLVFWTINLFRYNGKPITAYKNIPFEREANSHEEDLAYLKIRKNYAWIKK